jgi:chemotaxis protein methyltransferase CheR
VDSVRSLAELVELVRKRTGIVTPAGRETALRAALRRAAPGLEPDAFLDAAADPVRGPALVQRLIDEVTIQETTFVRDRGQLDAIAWQSLRDSARAAGAPVIRVWSAGCATGEEPYTLALLAAEAFRSMQPPVEVLGTDISGPALAAAAAGQYRERAVRALDARLRDRYFRALPDGSHLVGEELRRRVRFRRHNLARDPVPPPGEAAFDLIICRNIFIYFEAEVVRCLIPLLERALRPGGILLLGAADALARTAALGPAPRSMAARGAAADPGRAALARPAQRAVPPVPPQPGPLVSRAERLKVALGAAGRGDRYEALGLVAALLEDDQMDSDAHFVYGLVALEAGQPERAAGAFRRAMYVDPGFSLAAFTLGRAYDALGDEAAARRAYEQALRMLDPADDRHELILQQVDIGDIATACRTRLGGSHEDTDRGRFLDHPAAGGRPSRR